MTNRIDELSKDLLKRYLNKAGNRKYQAKDGLEIDPRIAGKKIPKWSHTNSKSNRIDKMKELAKEKITPRVKVFATESEQIDELSKKTLGSYIKKASPSVVNKAMFDLQTTATIEDRKERKASRAKVFEQIDKREEGIRRAVNKLTKEETMEDKSLITLAEDKNILDFTSKVDEILRGKSIALVESLQGIEPEDEDDDEFDFDDEDSDDLDEESMAWIAENITDDEFEALDDESKERLTAFVESLEDPEEDGVPEEDIDDQDDEELEEGRGARGRMKHPAEEDEWGSKDRSSKSFKSFRANARKNKESMREEANQLEDTSTNEE